MLLVLHVIIKIVSFAFIATCTMSESISDDWRTIEYIAESHPYVVALLNGPKIHSCSGTIINARTVLTSGICVKKDIQYIAVALAVFDKDVDTKTLFKVASKRLHEEYDLQLTYDTTENITRMTCNLGLLFTTKPYLELFVNAADMGNYAISELKGTELALVGFGKLSDRITAMQKQIYRQIKCISPTWYNCLCGVEHTDAQRSKTYTENFGEGAPILYGSQIVGVAAFPAGSLEDVQDGNLVMYNVFTFTAPYLQWINKPEPESFLKVLTQETQTAPSSQNRFKVECLYLFIIASKIIS